MTVFVVFPANFELGRKLEVAAFELEQASLPSGLQRNTQKMSGVHLAETLVDAHVRQSDGLSLLTTKQFHRASFMFNLSLFIFQLVDQTFLQIMFPFLEMTISNCESITG